MKQLVNDDFVSIATGGAERKIFQVHDSNHIIALKTKDLLESDDRPGIMMYRKNPAPNMRAYVGNMLRNNKRDGKLFSVFELSGSTNYFRGMCQYDGDDVVDGTPYWVVRYVNDGSLRFLPTAHTVDGIVFRSALEIRLYRFFRSLGVQCEYEAARINLGDRTYTLDFFLPDVDDGVHVELKPTYPNEEEIAKCEAVAQKGFRVVLLYGEIRCPRAVRAPGSEYTDRPQAHGLRGLSWNAEGEMDRSDLVPCVVDDRLTFRRVTRVADTSWNHPNLVRAYADAEAS